MTLQQLLQELPNWAATFIAVLGAIMGVFTALHALFLLLSNVFGWKWASAAAEWSGVLAADIGKAVDLFAQLQAKRAAMKAAAKVALLVFVALLLSSCSRLGVFSDPTLEAIVDAFCGQQAVEHRAELESKAQAEKLSPADVIAAFQALCAARLKSGDRAAVGYALRAPSKKPDAR